VPQPIRAIQRGSVMGSMKGSRRNSTKLRVRARIFTNLSIHRAGPQHILRHKCLAVRVNKGGRQKVPRRLGYDCVRAESEGTGADGWKRGATKKRAEFVGGGNPI